MNRGGRKASPRPPAWVEVRRRRGPARRGRPFVFRAVQRGSTARRCPPFRSRSGAKAALACSFAVVREPIAGSQRGGLVGAAESGERIGSYEGAVFCPGVVCSRSRLVCRKRGLREGQSLSGACCVDQEARIMTSRPLRQRMAAAERLLTDGDRPTKEGLGLACMLGSIQQAGEVVEA
jgi:hypothetical protein